MDQESSASLTKQCVRSPSRAGLRQRMLQLTPGSGRILCRLPRRPSLGGSSAKGARQPTWVGKHENAPHDKEHAASRNLSPAAGNCLLQKITPVSASIDQRFVRPVANMRTMSAQQHTRPEHPMAHPEPESGCATGLLEAKKQCRWVAADPKTAVL